SWAKILQHDISIPDQPMYDRLSLGSFQIDRDRALVAVVGRKESGGEARQPPGRIAVDRLDLHHVGAEIGKYDAGARPHDGVTEIKHLQPRQRPGGSRHAARLLNAASVPDRSAALGSRCPTIRSASRPASISASMFRP